MKFIFSLLFLFFYFYEIFSITDLNKPEMIDASLAIVGEHIGPRFPVRLSDQVAPVAVSQAESVLRLEPVQAAMVPPARTQLRSGKGRYKQSSNVSTKI